MSKTGKRGGAGAAGGMNFQHATAAWLGVSILAESAAAPPWDLPSAATLESLQVETEEAVDDLFVRTSHCAAFCQVKRSLTLSVAQTSDLAKALDQFVRQAVATAEATNASNRHLCDEPDRLVLVVGRQSSASITFELPELLQRLRGHDRGQPLEAAAVNNGQRKVLDVVLAHLRRSWAKKVGVLPGPDDLQRVFRLMRVQVLDETPNGDLVLQAKDRLRGAILTDPTQADSAWALLFEAAAVLAATKGGATRTTLREHLLSAGIHLRPTPSYGPDVGRLQQLTQSTIRLVEQHSSVALGAARIRVDRASSRALQGFAEEASLLLVGEAGAGKSGALCDLVAHLRGEDRNVVFLSASHLASASQGQLRDELGLDHDLVQVLRQWQGAEPAFLVIDALDAARTDPSARALRELIGIVSSECPLWRIVASIRKFDLRYGLELREWFSGAPHPMFQDPEFATTRHMKVPIFSDDELEYVAKSHPAMGRLLGSAPQPLLELLRVPFNLRLAAELVGEGLGIEALGSLRTQLELLDRYWTYRVIGGDGGADERELALLNACNQMVATRSLQASRLEVAAASPGALARLLSDHVLGEWQANPSSPVNRYLVTFSHHVLFDYAVARLLLRGASGVLPERLRADRGFVVFARPSLVFQFQHLWSLEAYRSEHSAFWAAIFAIQAESTIPEIAKMVGPTTAVTLAQDAKELAPLIRSLTSELQEEREVAEGSFAYLVGGIVSEYQATGQLPSALWSELLEVVSRSLSLATAYPIRALLMELLGS